MASRRRRRRWHRTPPWLLSAVVMAGAAIVMALVWVGASPHVPAVWTGQRWTSDAYNAELITYDMAFAGLSAGAGVLTAGYLVVAAGWAHPIRRTLSVLAFAAAGSALTWGLGMVFGHSPAPKAGQTGVGPVALSSPILLVVWPGVAALISAVALALLALLPRRWRPQPGDDEQSAADQGMERMK